MVQIKLNQGLTLSIVVCDPTDLWHPFVLISLFLSFFVWWRLCSTKLENLVLLYPMYILIFIPFPPLDA